MRELRCRQSKNRARLLDGHPTDSPTAWAIRVQLRPAARWRRVYASTWARTASGIRVVLPRCPSDGLLGRGYIPQHVLGVRGGRHATVNGAYPAVGPDQIRDATGDGLCGRVGRPDGDGERAFVVREQAKRETLGLDEGLVLRGRVERHAEYLDPPLLERREAVTQPIALRGAAGSHGLGIEPQQVRLAREVARRDRGAGLVAERPCREGVARVEERAGMQRGGDPEGEHEQDETPQHRAVTMPPSAICDQGGSATTNCPSRVARPQGVEPPTLSSDGPGG